MNERQPLRRWAMGVALCLSVGAVGGAGADTTPISDTLEVRVTASEQQLPIKSFYQYRDYQPVWTTAASVEALVAGLNALEQDGINPENYASASLMEAFERSQAGGESAQVTFELQASQALLQALDHLNRGQVNPRELSAQWDAERPSRGYSMGAVAKAVNQMDMAAAFDQARPDSSAYRRLRAAFIDFQSRSLQSSVPYLDHREESLRPGDQHDDVLTLRRRLTHWGEPHLLAANPQAYPLVDVDTPDQRHFDAPLAAAVKRFQRRHLLQEDGVVGEQTRRALNVPLSLRAKQLKVNLERARWMGSQPDNAPRVWVDLAGYRLHYNRPGGEHWQTRVVVGSPQRATPVIQSAITHLTLNPSWTIPPTIMREDVLPRVREDVGYLAEENIQVVDFDGNPVNAEEVDWQQPGSVMLRQVAGSANPLGSIVVRFPNDHMIYLHDTPAQGLFQRHQRALSSGCVRVEGVTQFAQLLLEDTGSSAQVASLVASSQSDRQLSLPRRVPIALHYLTAWPNAEGEVEFRPDIYGHDAAVESALSQPMQLSG
ncbi:MULTISPECIES: L,D-transpeptidase family protein [Halomonadaceae]|uniref:L,D-transpeptidase family protein n=1 Tax=Halomonadaceae TaxID=28256 RepID=UPI0018EF9306|nr:MULTISPECIES: L,D-transpeptidase family protein [Halomonas]MCW4148763.1 L,D-transpeptidase family protein [Halomonas sp. 18H]MCZ0930467.1 L,D-transpeptidase family protein [Halomonas janggokensis]MDR5884726.1 L,D-transpeptidase family protein [Halomonas janggokensis]QPL45247.1 L,D-transpeptidase family protein [Halomonas sp. A40-4]